MTCDMIPLFIITITHKSAYTWIPWVTDIFLQSSCVHTFSGKSE